MKVTNEKTENRQAYLKIEVDSEEVEAANAKAFKRLVKQVNVPGFRRGNAPRSIFEQHFGKDRLFHEALDDPKVFKIVCRKSAQVAWTDGVLLNYIGRRVDIDPVPMIVMFAKTEAAKQFNDEKLTPMIEVGPPKSSAVTFPFISTVTTVGVSDR